METDLKCVLDYVFFFLFAIKNINEMIIFSFWLQESIWNIIKIFKTVRAYNWSGDRLLSKYQLRRQYMNIFYFFFYSKTKLMYIIVQRNNKNVLKRTFRRYIIHLHKYVKFAFIIDNGLNFFIPGKYSEPNRRPFGSESIGKW